MVRVVIGMLVGNDGGIIGRCLIGFALGPFRKIGEAIGPRDARLRR
jgi:hypothetical protein